MATGVQALLDDAKTFQQMMAMDGEIKLGDPEDECSMIGSENGYRGSKYVVTVTGKDQHPFIIGCFRSHSSALALMREEFERIKDHAEFVGATKKNAEDRDRPNWRPFDVENFIDKETGARYDIIATTLCEPPDEYATTAIVEVKDGIPTMVNQFKYNMQVREEMVKRWNETQKDKTGQSYTRVPGNGGAITSITMKDGTKYYVTPATHKN